MAREKEINVDEKIWNELKQEAEKLGYGNFKIEVEVHDKIIKQALVFDVRKKIRA